MAEVRVKIGADIKDLQKGVRDAQNEVGKLATSARSATGALGGSAKGIEEVKESARRFIQQSKELRKSLEDSGSSSLSFASVFRGAMAADIVLHLASALKDKLVDSLNTGTKAAADARDEFKRLYGQVSDFKALAGTIRVFENREQIIEEGRRVEKAIEDVNDRLKSQGAEGRTVFGFDIGGIDEAQRKVIGFLSEAQKQQNFIIENDRKRLGELLGQQDSLKTQLALVDGANRIENERSGTTLKTREELEKQADALRESVKAAEELLRLRAAANAAVGVNLPIGSRRTPKATTPMPDRPDKVFDETAASAAGDFAFALEDIQSVLDAGLISSLSAAGAEIDLMKARMAEMVVQGLAGTDAYKELSEQFNEVRKSVQLFNDVGFGITTVVDVGADLAEVWYEVNQGFIESEQAIEQVRDIVQGLISSLVRAAAKALLLTGLMKLIGFASGGTTSVFGGLLRGALGIGTVGAAPALAGVSPVAPLGTLSQASQPAQVMIPELTIRGNDLVVAFQRARNESARTLGNIPLK